MEGIMMTLREHRARQAWSQGELASRAGVVRKTILMIEAGGSPSHRTCRALAAALEVDLEDIAEVHDAIQQRIQAAGGRK
jgi:DNA-binding XRE family transcriptional regulator